MANLSNLAHSAPSCFLPWSTPIINLYSSTSAATVQTVTGRLHQLQLRKRPVQQEKLNIPGPETLSDAVHPSPLPYVAVGDDGFPLKHYLLRSYPGRPLTENKEEKGFSPLGTLQSGAARVNLTTDLRNIIHQINPNDLLCAYKPTFEKWATRTLQDLDPGFGMWDIKNSAPSSEEASDPKDQIPPKNVPRSETCSYEPKPTDDKFAVRGWEVCSSRHTAAATAYQRDLSAVKLSVNRRSQSSSAVEKPAECRRQMTMDKTRIKLGLHLNRKSIQDMRVRDYTEDRAPFPGPHNALARPLSPKYVPFKHCEGHRQHMEHYREAYTYKKIQNHKNQYVRRALACGLTLQNYPLRGFSDMPCSHCPGFVRSPITRDQSLITSSQSNCLLKTTARTQQLQPDVLVTDRKRNLLPGNGAKTMTTVSRKGGLVPPVSQNIANLNNGMMSMDMYHDPPCPGAPKDMGKVVLDVPLIVCRTHPSLTKTSQPEKMYQLTEPSAIVGPDTASPQKR